MHITGDYSARRAAFELSTVYPIISVQAKMSNAFHPNRICDKVVMEIEEDRYPCLLYELFSPICQRQCRFTGRSTLYFETTSSKW